MAATKMHSGAQCRRQANVAGDNQHQPAGPADACEVAAQSGAIRIVVVTEHDPGETARESRNRRSRIGRSPGVGEQPKRRDRAGRVVPSRVPRTGREMTVVGGGGITTGDRGVTEEIQGVTEGSGGATEGRRGVTAESWALTFAESRGGAAPGQKFRVHLRSSPERPWWWNTRNAAPRSAVPKGRSHAPPSLPR